MSQETVSRQHLLVGWVAISVYIALGILLETLHALKAGYLLDVNNETRRQMWMLSHAHGTLFGLINIALSWTISRVDDWSERSLLAISRATLAATILVPGGFFLGGPLRSFR